MEYPQKWTGSETEKTGIAAFMVDGEAYAFLLQEFSDMDRLSRMLDAAWKQGRKSSVNLVIASIEKELRSLRDRFID